MGMGIVVRRDHARYVSPGKGFRKMSPHLLKLFATVRHFFRHELKRKSASAKLLFAITVLTFAPVLEANGASPSSATLGPADATPILWTGTATGPAAPAVPPLSGVPELPSCIEGVNCDSFKINIDGTEADWTGKVARIRIDWLLPTTDYDLYVVRDTPTRVYIIAYSTYNPPGSLATHEIADLTPAWNGTGEYRVLVVYRNATAADQYTGSASVVAIPAAQCGVPGESVLTDIYGDSMDKQAAHDLYSLHIGEPYVAGTDKLVFTMEVANLSWLSPNTFWRVYFRAPDAAGSQYFVDMRTDAFGGVSYKYGTGDGTTLGDADAGSYDPRNNSITITISNSKIGNPQPNQTPPHKLDQIFMQVILGALVVDTAPSNNVPFWQGSYTLVGNAACQ